MIRIYIMPLKGGGSRQDPRRPKYADLVGVSAFGSIRYGEEGMCLTAMELTQEAHDIINADSEVLALPEDIDSLMGSAAVSIAQQFCEVNNIPGNWINSSYSFRSVLRIMLGCFLYAQRFAVIVGKEKIFIDSIDLDSLVGDLPSVKRSAMMQAAESLGIDYAAITVSWTLRQVLKYFGSQWINTEIDLTVVKI